MRFLWVAAITSFGRLRFLWNELVIAEQLSRFDIRKFPSHLSSRRVERRLMSRLQLLPIVITVLVIAIGNLKRVTNWRHEGSAGLDVVDRLPKEKVTPSTRESPCLRSRQHDTVGELNIRFLTR